MARFLGDSTGKTTTTYVDKEIANLCSFVNTDKLACNGDGTLLSNVVNTLSVAGSGLSIDQSSGAVTITSAGGGGDPKVLFACNGCWNGSATIPVESRGVYSRYEIFGQTCYWQYYCSQATFAFAGACGGTCADNFAQYCCAHCSCGWIGDYKCFNGSYRYDCGGAIAWPFGCDSSCSTACSSTGFHFHASIVPDNACCGSQRGFQYCFSTSRNGDSAPCCIGVRNAGYGYSCCGAHPACLKGICFTTPSATYPYAGPTNVIIVGYGAVV